MRRETINRTIHYYDMNFEYASSFNCPDGDLLREFFSKIAFLGESKHEIRYQTIGERSLFIQNVRFEVGSKVISGMLRSVRKDLLPEIMNVQTDEAKGMEMQDHEGIVDTTHFVIDYTSAKRVKLAIEYNLYGAKISDILQYWIRVGKKLSCVENISYVPIVKRELDEMQRRLGECSLFTVRVHKDNVADIEAIDNATYTSMVAIQDQFESEYVQLELKYDIKSHTPQKAQNSIKKFFAALKQSPKKIDLFNKLEVRGENIENKSKIEVFDLLSDKVISKITVDKVPLFKTVSSSHMLELMKNEFLNRKI
jgi:hypothetical protein